jgi:transcription initiation factor TFIIIB Brf1 subunit/transcription initiation factor TFIIB
MTKIPERGVPPISPVDKTRNEQHDPEGKMPQGRDEFVSSLNLPEKVQKAIIQLQNELATKDPGSAEAEDISEKLSILQGKLKSFGQ